MARNDTYSGTSDDINQATDEHIRVIIAKLADAVAQFQKESPSIEIDPVETAAAARFLEIQSRLGLIAPHQSFLQQEVKA